MLPITEDGYFALSVARKAAEGYFFSVDGVNPTNGFQPLWPTLLAGASYLTCDGRECMVRLATAFSSVLAIASALLWATVSSHFWGRGSLLHKAVFAVVYLTQFQLLIQHFNGLETGLALTLLGLAGYLFTRMKDHLSPGASLAMGVLLGLIALCRIDAVLFAMIYCAAVLLLPAAGTTLRARFLSAVITAVASASVFMPWIIYNLHIGGHPMPVSGRALALDAGLSSLTQRIPNTIGALGRDILPHVLGDILHGGLNLLAGCAVIALAIGLAYKSRRDADDRAMRARIFMGITLAYGCGMLAAYTANSGASYFYARYFIIFSVFFVGAAAALIVPLLERSRGAAIAVLALIVVPGWLTVAGWHGVRAGAYLNDFQTYMNPPLLGQVEMAARFAKPEERVGALQTGTLSFFRDNTENLDGKVSLGAYEARKNGRLIDFVNSRNINVMIDFADFFEKNDRTYFGDDLSRWFDRVYPEGKVRLYQMVVLRRRSAVTDNAAPGQVAPH